MKSLYFLKYLLTNNLGKLFIIISTIACIITLLNSEIKPQEYELGGEFTHNKTGINYVVYEVSLNNKMQVDKSPTNISDGYIDTENNLYVRDEIRLWQLFMGIYVVFSVILYIVMTFSDDFPWNKRWCLAQTGKHFVKVYEDNGEFYYKYNNKLLYTSGVLLDNEAVVEKVYRFLGKESNLYPDYEGPTQIVRDRKLGDILS